MLIKAGQTSLTHCEKLFKIKTGSSPILVIIWINKSIDSNLNKWNPHLKTAGCIYSGYLCLILKLVFWWIWNVEVLQLM